MTDDLRTRAEVEAEERYPQEPDRGLTYPREAIRQGKAAAFIDGALWHAAQQPSRDLSDAEVEAGARALNPQAWEMYDNSAAEHRESMVQHTRDTARQILTAALYENGAGS